MRRVYCRQNLRVPCMSYTDVDLAEFSGSFILVTLGCGNGTLSLSTVKGLRFVSGEPRMWSGELTFDGFAAFYAGLDDANTALAGLKYRPHEQWSGNDTIVVTADDRAWSSEVK